MRLAPFEGISARRLLPALIAIAVALAGIVALLPRPATGTSSQHSDFVVIAGAAGLRWDDVTPTDTPALWELGQRGAIGALGVRSARGVTCPADGWLTLGAGNYARSTSEPVDEHCPTTYPSVVQVGSGHRIEGYDEIARQNRELSYGTETGALTESVRCTAAVGPGAAVAAARPFGRVDRYAETLPADLAELLSSCILSFVDLGVVSGEGGEGSERQEAARRADAALARVLAARPPRSLVLVAGLSDTDVAGRLHVVAADGPGFGKGWLSSPSTGRDGYVRLIDLAPTALAALNRPVPAKLFAGAAALRIDGRPDDLAAAVRSLSDADRLAGAKRRVSGDFYLALTVAQLLLFALLVPLLRRARRSAGPWSVGPVPPRLVHVVEVGLIAAALAVPAAMVADLLPWWRFAWPGTTFAAVLLVVLAAATALVLFGVRRYRALGPLGGVSALAAGVVAVDLFTGARLQLDGVAGYSALNGGRFAGVGTIGLGMFTAGVLLAAGCLAQRVGRAWRPVVIASVGALGVVIIGSPYLGADAGGAVALTAGVCAAAAMATGGWLTFPRLAWAVVAGFAATTAFALLDLRRPAEHQLSAGRFLSHLDEGTAGLVISRVGGSSVVVFATSPLTLLVIGGAAFTFLVLLRPWGGLRRLFGLFPAVRGALAGVVVATLIAGAIEGVALNIAGAALATALPLTALATLRVQHHADDRTQPGRPVREPAQV